MLDLNGNDEKFKDISCLEGKYLISNHGRIYSQRRETVAKNGMNHVTHGGFLKPRLMKNGYYYVNLPKYGTISVHKLVAVHFLEFVSGKNLINHKDGNKENNYYMNLEWCTQRENNIHAIKKGLRKKVLSEDQKKEIRDYVKENGRNAESHKFLAKKYERTEATIRLITRGVY